MKQVYSFLLMVTLLIIACSPKATQDSVKAVEVNKTTTSNKAYETTILKDGIPSPMKEMKTKINDATISVVYGSPSVKGRTVWGDLVPYDKVWRTGANEATTFESSTALKIQGKELAAGKYGLFTIPTESGKWTVIFNSVHEQWGAYKYDESKDVLRVEATTKDMKASVEAMNFIVEDNNIVFQWDKLSLPVQVSK